MTVLSAPVSAPNIFVFGPWIRRIGGSSPLTLPRNVRMACVKGLFTTISSWIGSYEKPCMVLLSFVRWPSMVRTGGSFNFASRAKPAICGWVTQFGTHIWSRLES